MPRGLVSTTPAVTAGYVLFSPARSSTVYLMANDGSVVHTWDNGYGDISHYLEADGTLLRGFRDPEILHFRQGGVTGGDATTLVTATYVNCCGNTLPIFASLTLTPVVPEPAALIYFALGICGLLALRRG